ncbi:MAG: methyltransferase domain-containing protein [Ignavibacteria bacterium]|jgi:SAM-dependent methyltransferase|nr:class I SAM-dependent methyltransferase [Ignavibacteria bacterium]MDH7528791.1 methyltransferase domain-containing protein [Ignavibacteria bacterium]NPV10627.1 class I SAM-dependent methyltransferase [Ignavibacteria bacterium]
MNQDQKTVIEKFTKHLNPDDVFDVREDWHYMFQSKFKVDYRLISKIPDGLKNKKVLNVGTFFPIDEIYFASRVKEFYSIDIAPEIIRVANEIADKEIHPDFRNKIKIQVADATNLPFESNYFDVSFSFSTLEHIPDEEKRNKAFQELVRVTKTGGYVIITVPNKLNIGKYLRSLRMQKNGTSPFGYEHHYTPKQLKKILIRNGVKPIFYCSSAGDLSGVFFRIHDFIVRPFGHRMGWIGIKE